LARAGNIIGTEGSFLSDATQIANKRFSRSFNPTESTFWLALENLTSIVISFLVTLALARYLLPELFGKLSLLVAVIAIVSPFMTLGLNSLITREIFYRPSESDLILGSALGMRTAAGVMIAAFVSFMSRYYLAYDDWKLFVFLVISSIFNAPTVFDFWIQAHVANRLAVKLRLFILFIFSASRLIAIHMDCDFSVFVYLLGMETVFHGVGFLGLYQLLNKGCNRLRFAFDECLKLARDGRWLFVSGVAAVLYLKIDQVMLGIMLGDQAVGVYSVAAKLSEVWYFVPAVVVTSYFPHLLSIRDSNIKEYYEKLQKTNDFLFSSALVLAVLTTFSAGWLVPFLFGMEYLLSVEVLLVHIWAAILVFMRTLLSKWLIAENLLKISLLSQVSGAIANIILNYFLIPMMGPVGAAYATVASYAVASYAILFLRKETRPMALVVTRSLILPYRLLIARGRLYSS
jgi:O-antigen/teichoic acid export membrane protein